MSAFLAAPLTAAYAFQPPFNDAEGQYPSVKSGVIYLPLFFLSYLQAGFEECTGFLMDSFKKQISFSFLTIN